MSKLTRPATLLLLAVAACAQAPTPPLRIAEDHSLSESEYIALGVPAHDHVWTADDYTRATAVLKSIATSDPTKLPRVHSKASELVFARLVAAENLDLALQLGDSPDQRIPYLLQLYPAVNESLSIYARATNSGTSFDEELVELMLFLVDASCRLAADGEAVFARFSPQDPAYATRVQGLEQMRSGLASVASGALQTLTEKHVYRPGALLRLATGLHEHFPDLVTHLPAASRQEIPLRLAHLVSHETDPTQKAALQTLLEAVNDSTGHGP